MLSFRRGQYALRKYLQGVRMVALLAEDLLPYTGGAAAGLKERNLLQVNAGQRTMVEVV